MNKQMEYVRTMLILSEVNKRIGELKEKIADNKEDDKAKIDLGILINRAIKLNSQLLELQDLDKEVV